MRIAFFEILSSPTQALAADFTSFLDPLLSPTSARDLSVPSVISAKVQTYVTSVGSMCSHFLPSFGIDASVHCMRMLETVRLAGQAETGTGACSGFR